MAEKNTSKNLQVQGGACVLRVRPGKMDIPTGARLRVQSVHGSVPKLEAFATLVYKGDVFVDEATGQECLLPWGAARAAKYTVSDGGGAGVAPVTVSIGRNGRWAAHCGQTRIASGFGEDVEFGLSDGRPSPAIKVEISHKPGDGGEVHCTVAVTNIGNIPLGGLCVRHAIAPLCAAHPERLSVMPRMEMAWPAAVGELPPGGVALATCDYALRAMDRAAHGFTSRVSASASSPQGHVAADEANEVYMLPLDAKNMDGDGCVRLAEETLRRLSEEYVEACRGGNRLDKQTVGRFIRRHPFLCLVAADIDGILDTLERKAARAT